MRNEDDIFHIDIAHNESRVFPFTRIIKQRHNNYTVIMTPTCVLYYLASFGFDLKIDLCETHFILFMANKST